VRCANTGISYFVTPKGKVEEATEIFTQRVIVKKIPLRDKLTFYAKWGDWFGWGCIIFFSLSIFFSLFFTKSFKNS
jgi:apolipoprotein N-acyltransferase